MAHELDMQRILGSINDHLATQLAAENIHWPGTEGATDDVTWVEPWLSLSLVPSRVRDWLYNLTLTVNVFTKRSTTTYAGAALAGKVVAACKGITIEVKDHDNPSPVVKGYAKLFVPDVVDLGELTKDGSRVGLRQITVRCDGTVYPLAA